MSGVIVFDDGRGDLGPMTELRAAFAVRTGALTTLERIERTLGDRVGALIVPGALAPLTREQTGLPVNDADSPFGGADAGGGALLLSGRCVLPAHDVATLPLGTAIVDKESGDVVAARLSAAEARSFVGGGGGSAGRPTCAPPRGVKVVESSLPVMVRRPWDVIRLRDACLAHDLALLHAAETQPLPEGVVAIGEHDLTIAPDAAVYPTAVLDLERGPIVIDSGAVVRPGAIVCGPAYIGRGSVVVERAHVKANTAIGPVCKVGGEVGGTIFQGYANKAHDGHLGDSWVGEWANLGAGTTNSNLLNTYGEVIARAACGKARERTGLTFYGCVVGDHVKLAIGTRLMTGAAIGTGTMIARTAPVADAVGAFRWVTDEGEMPFRFAKFLETARAAMSRRDAALGEAMTERLRALHDAGGS